VTDNDLDGAPPLPNPPDPVPAPPTWGQRHRKLITGAVIAVVVLAAGTVLVAGIQQERAEEERRANAPSLGDIAGDLVDSLEEALKPPSVEMRAENLGEAWPLTVSPIEVQCRKDGGFRWVTFEHDGQTYNVTDPRPLPTWRDFSEVWAGADGEGVGDQATESMKSITPVIDAGLALC
jgi:hypothetical protein